MDSVAQISNNTFAKDGYLVVRRFRDAAFCRAARAEVHRQLQPLLAPVEFEADVGYPGAPTARDVEGGQTARRLLSAYARFPRLRELAVAEDVMGLLDLLGVRDPQLSQCHHNCVMTKHPGFSSATLWHQDIRYWSFDRPELISLWMALGEETEHNGALWVIPGSHEMALDRGRLDAELFLRPELQDNRQLIERAMPVALEPGDALLFHSRLFHAAGKNQSDALKLSAVFTYHSQTNRPIPGTRSATYPSISLAET